MRLMLSRVLILLTSTLIATADARAATERYNVDPDHSIVGFSVVHMVISKTTGRFKDYTGFIEMDPDAKTLKAIEAVIQTASIDTNHVKRDTHLRSQDFLNVEKYPTMTYKMKSYEKLGDNQYRAKGDLTLLGVTKEVVLTGTLNEKRCARRFSELTGDGSALPRPSGACAPSCYRRRPSEQWRES